MDPAQLLHDVVKQAGKLYFRFTWSQTQRKCIHIYIVYGMDPAQLLHDVVKQAGKLYFRFTWSQTQRKVFT